MVDISECIQKFPLELQWEIGQHLGLYFSLSADSAQTIINKTNYKKYVNHALQRDNVEHLKVVINTISSFDDIEKYIDELTTKCDMYAALYCLKLLTKQGYYKHGAVTYIAAMKEHLACLQYLTEKGYYKHGYATYYAAENGHLSCLRNMDILNINGY